jgi:hypothetical protein
VPLSLEGYKSRRALALNALKKKNEKAGDHEGAPNPGAPFVFRTKKQERFFDRVTRRPARAGRRRGIGSIRSE